MSGKGSKGGQVRRKGRRRRKSKKSEAAKVNDFWGAESTVVDLDQTVVVAHEPAALVRSLGPAPLAKHEAAADAYFEAIYLRASALSGALGAAGGLLEQSEA